MSEEPESGVRLERDDAVLVREIALGDASALDRLISRYWGPLTLYAARVVGDRTRAEDVVQTVFIRLWQDRRQGPPRSVRSYLFRVTRNLALDELRSSNARSARESRSAVEGANLARSPAELLDADRLSDAIDAAIRQLSERRRDAFTLAYLHGLTYAEVAEVMSVSPKTVGHHVSAALAELRKRLSHLIREPASGAP